MAIKQAPRLNYSLSGIGTEADPFKVATGGVRANELENIEDVAGVYANPANMEIDGQGRVISIEDGATSGGTIYTPAQFTRCMVIAKLSSTSYSAPASVGSQAILTINSWVNFKMAVIQADLDLDYDGGNPFVLNIVDSSGLSNTWNPTTGTPAFDLVLPVVQPLDGGPTVTPLFAKELLAYGVSEGWRPEVSWLAGTLTLTFDKTQFLGKSRNIIKISL